MLVHAINEISNVSDLLRKALSKHDVYVTNQMNACQQKQGHHNISIKFELMKPFCKKLDKIFIQRTEYRYGVLIL